MIKKLILKIGGGWIFLILVVLAYLITAFFDISILIKSWEFLKIIFWQIAPVLILVFGLIFLANLLLSSKRVIKYLGEASGIKGWLLSAGFGILSSGPIYMWYPLLSDLKEKGMDNSLMAVFLYNRAVKIPLMPMIVLYFGWPFLLIMTVLMIAFSFLNGFLTVKLITK